MCMEGGYKPILIPIYQDHTKSGLGKNQFSPLLMNRDRLEIGLINDYY